MAKIVLNDELTYNITDFNRFINLLDGTMQIVSNFTIANNTFTALMDTLKDLTVTSLKILNDQDSNIYELTDISAHVKTIDETLVQNAIQTHVTLNFD